MAGSLRRSMGKKRVEYRCVATSVEGFVQQVAVQYLRHGYWFYVAGQIPEGKDSAAVDAKVLHDRLVRFTGTTAGKAGFVQTARIVEIKCSPEWHCRCF